MKYILEIKPEYEANGIMILGARDSHLYVTTLEVKDLEELNSDYINEHYGDLQDTAYQRGLNDAWKAAKKIVLDTNHGGIALSDLSKIFGGQSYTYIMNKNTAQEVIEKLKAYEEKQTDDEIKVGDEVERSVYGRTEGKGIYLEDADEGGDWLKCLFWTGATFTVLAYPKEQFKKTGRHFDISSILKEMQS